MLDVTAFLALRQRKNVGGAAAKIALEEETPDRHGRRRR